MREKIMQSVLKYQRKKFLLAMIFTFAFVVGIPLIIMGAINGLWFMLGIGCAFSGISFYATPLAWVGYGNTFKMVNLVKAVKEQNIYTTENLQDYLKLSKNQTITLVQKAVFKGFLAEYTFKRDEVLILNSNIKQELNKYSLKCPNCGATVTIDAKSGYGVCGYCQTVVTKDTALKDGEETK